jgi:tetratricopeptide (TPR) repeat protein
LGLYEIAKKYFQLCINEYSNLSNFDCEWFRYKVAFCTYYSSLVNEAFELTYRLKNDIENNSRLDSLYYDVLSLLATLYHEKSDINNTKKYYLSALNECKKNSFDREYHILLRKSDLCFEPNLSVSHVIEACNYFKSISDMKEYSKAIHNLGIAYLYMGEWDNAYKFLNEALICFNSFGSIEALYPFNGLGILSIVNEKDLNKALNFFQRADYTEMNAFKKITVWLNQSMCCQKLGDRQNAWKKKKKCEILPHCQINKDYAYYNRTIYLAKALFHKNFNNKEESLEWFIKCLDIPLENNQLSLVTKNIVLLSKELHLPVNEKTMQTSKMSHMPLISVYLEDDILFHELSFLE